MWQGVRQQPVDTFAFGAGRHGDIERRGCRIVIGGDFFGHNRVRTYSMRGLKALVIGMGVLIVAGVVFLIYAIIDKAGEKTAAGPSGGGRPAGRRGSRRDQYRRRHDRVAPAPRGRIRPIAGHRSRDRKIPRPDRPEGPVMPGPEGEQPFGAVTAIRRLHQVRLQRQAG